MIENFHMYVWKTIQDVNYVRATIGTENLLDLLFMYSIHIHIHRQNVKVFLVLFIYTCGLIIIHILDKLVTAKTPDI